MERAWWLQLSKCLWGTSLSENKCWVCSTTLTPNELISICLESVIRTKMKFSLDFNITFKFGTHLQNTYDMPSPEPGRHFHSQQHVDLTKRPCEMYDCAQWLRVADWPAWSHRGQWWSPASTPDLMASPVHFPVDPAGGEILTLPASRVQAYFWRMR